MPASTSSRPARPAPRRPAPPAWPPATAGTLLRRRPCSACSPTPTSASPTTAQRPHPPGGAGRAPRRPSAWTPSPTPRRRRAPGVPRVLFVCSRQRGPLPDGRRPARPPRGGPRRRAPPPAPIPPPRSSRSSPRSWPRTASTLADAFPKPLTDEVVAGRRHRDHHGLRRRLPRRARPPLPGLARRRPRGRADQRRTHHPRRHRRPHHRTARRASPPSDPLSHRPLIHSRRKNRCPTSPLASVLFVCVHNAGRSQMAAGFLTHLAGDRDRGPLRRLHPRRPGQPRRRRGHEGGRHRHLRREPEDPHHRGRPGVRRTSSPWAAATPAPSSPASVPRLGPRGPGRARASRPSGPSATRSRPASRA